MVVKPGALRRGVSGVSVRRLAALRVSAPGVRRVDRATVARAADWAHFATNYVFAVGSVGFEVESGCGARVDSALLGVEQIPTAP